MYGQHTSHEQTLRSERGSHTRGRLITGERRDRMRDGMREHLMG